MRFPFVLLFSFLFIQVTLAQQALKTGFKAEGELVENSSHPYEVSLEAGEVIEIILQQSGVDAKILLLNSAGDTITVFDSPTGSTGLEEIQFIAEQTDDYVFRVEPLRPEDEAVVDPEEIRVYLEANQGQYSIEEVEIISAKEYKARIAAEEARFNSIVDWFNDNSVPFNTVEAENGFEDLQFLKPILKNVQIVGLGEATHGTREFFQMKHRMLEFLVVEMGFTVFAIEASYSACLNINNYVLHGMGTKEKALRSQGFWTWDTEEVLDMIEWMRQYNLTVNDSRKVKFYGFDMQDYEDAADWIKPVLSQLDTTLSIRFDSLRILQDSTAKLEYEDFEQKHPLVTHEANALLATIVMNEGRLKYGQDAELYESLIEHYRIFLQAWETNVDYKWKSNYSRFDGIELRDYYMAENVQYLLNKEGKDTKMVLWAHNGHINQNPDVKINGGLKPIGAYLDEQLGDAYYTMAFAFNKGSFQAIDFTAEERALQEFVMEPAAKPATDWMLAQAGNELSIINFRQDLPSFMLPYLKEEVAFFGTGAGYGSTWGRYATPRPNFQIAHDAIIFINETTRAIPSEAIKSRMTVK